MPQDSKCRKCGMSALDSLQFNNTCDHDFTRAKKMTLKEAREASFKTLEKHESQFKEHLKEDESAPQDTAEFNKRFDEAIRPNNPDIELYLVPNISRENKFWAIERKTEEVKAFIAAERQRAVEEERDRSNHCHKGNHFSHRNRLCACFKSLTK